MFTMCIMFKNIFKNTFRNTFRKISSTIFAAVLTAMILFVLSSMMLNSVMTAMAVPFKEHRISDGISVIESEDFDAGNDGDYYESDIEDGQHQYRTGVGPQTEEASNSKRTDIPDGVTNYNVGWVNPDEYLQYTVIVENDGFYQFQAWLASGSDSPGGVEFYYNDNLIGYNEPEEQGDWQKYELYDIGRFNMTEGTHVVKALFPYGGCNIDAIVITRIGDVIATEPPGESENEIPAETDGEDIDDITAERGGADETASESDAAEENNIVLYIIIAVAAMAVIVVIIVLVARKK